MTETGTKIDSLRGAVSLAHFFLSQRVRPGDAALDATCGKGQDTLLLARLVGEGGKVWGFDLQPEAIAATRELLTRAAVADRVELVQAGHERLADFVARPLCAAVFNLGYLPGGESSLVTAPESTLPALEQATGLLRVGGIATISVYTGHPGGAEEGGAVERWCAALSPRNFNVWRHRQLNRPDSAPYLILVERVK